MYNEAKIPNDAQGIARLETRVRPCCAAASRRTRYVRYKKNRLALHLLITIIRPIKSENQRRPRNHAFLTSYIDNKGTWATVLCMIRHSPSSFTRFKLHRPSYRSSYVYAMIVLMPRPARFFLIGPAVVVSLFMCRYQIVLVLVHVGVHESLCFASHAVLAQSLAH